MRRTCQNFTYAAQQEVKGCLQQLKVRCLPRKSLERVTLTTSTSKLNSQQTLTNFHKYEWLSIPQRNTYLFCTGPHDCNKKYGGTTESGKPNKKCKVRELLIVVNIQVVSSATLLPWMPEDMREKCIRLIHSLTGRYSMDFNYHDLFSKFFARPRMEKEMEEEEEQKMDEQKLREFGTETDEDEDDAKEEDQQEEKERELSKN